jgi:serine/threonine protein kinase
MARVDVGTRLGNYVLLEQVGRGTFGEVWKARHHIWDDQVAAVKVPTDEQYVRTLQKEGMVVHGLTHPNIVRVIDLDPFADTPYLIMEYVDGRSLRALLAEKGRLDVATAADHLRQMLEGLRCAHGRGIIHRDIKPENILIGGDGVVKIADFGLGRVSAVTTQSLLVSGSLQTDEGNSISGTLAYMAPEQQQPGAEVGAPADLYALGIVFFEMLTGTRPQGMDAPSDVVAGLPAWTDAVFRRAYTRLERRYASAEEMLKALEESRRGGGSDGITFPDDRPGASAEAPDVVIMDELRRNPPPRRPTEPVIWLEDRSREVRREPVRFELPPVAARPVRREPPPRLIVRPPPAAVPGEPRRAETPQTEENRRCAACSHPVAAGDNYCMKCGRQLVPAIRRCERCGGYPDGKDKYCTFCGHELGVLSIG